MKLLFDFVRRIWSVYMNIYNVILACIGLGFTYVFPTAGIFLSMLSIDSIYSAVDFVKHSINQELSESMVLETNGNMYKVGIIERYIYYFSAAVVNSFLSAFVFNHYFCFAKHLLIMTMVPVIFNNYTHKLCEPIFDKIISEKNDLIKKVYIEQTANIIVQLEKIYISETTMLEKKEIMIALEDLTKIKAELPSFFKNSLVTLLLIYLRKNSRPYYKTAKWLYVYMAGDYIKDMTGDDAKKLFKDVIQNKKYDQLTKPMFIQALIYLYYEKENTGEFYTFIKKLRFKLVTFCALWTFGSFFSGYMSVLVILLFSFGLVLTRKYPLAKNVLLPKLINIESYRIFDYIDDRIIVSTILTVIIGIFTKNIMLLSLINQFSGLILINHLSFNFARIVYNNTYYKLIGFFTDMNHDVQIIAKYLLIILSYILFFNITPHVTYFLPIIINFVGISSRFFKYLYPILFIGLVNNNGNYLKLLFLGYVLSAVDNISTLKIKNPMQQIVSNKLINDDYFSNTSVPAKQTNITSKPIIIASPKLEPMKSPTTILPKTLKIYDLSTKKPIIDEIDYLNPTSSFLKKSSNKLG